MEPWFHVDFSVSVNADAAVEFRFGFSVNERREIFRRIVRVEYRAQKEAELRYPNELQVSEIHKKLDYSDKLSDKYKNELARELEISLDELKEVSQEGILHNWAMPAWPY